MKLLLEVQEIRVSYYVGFFASQIIHKMSLSTFHRSYIFCRCLYYIKIPW